MSRLVVFSVLAAFVVLVAVGCTEDDLSETATSRAEVLEIVRAENARNASNSNENAPNVTTPVQGLSREDVEDIIREVLSEMEGTESGITLEEARTVIQSSLAAIPPKTSPAEYTKFYVESAISMYETEGLEETLRHYNRVESVDGQWYLFIINGQDKVIGHFNEKARGVDIKGPLGTDALGHVFGEQIITATEDGKWVSYVHRNPDVGGTGPDHTLARELKHTWVVKHDGLIFASGWYVRGDEYAKFLVDEAIGKYRSSGLEAVLEHYNSAESADGRWFVFIADGPGTEQDAYEITAHYDEDFVGRSLDELLGTEAPRVTETGTWVSLVGVNPVTGVVQPKNFWLIDYDGVIFGSGWYPSVTEA